MKEVLLFLETLSQNNNREWFVANRSLYDSAHARFQAFAQQFIDGIAQFDPLCRNLALRDCTYRIYRDVRFSKDKSPYKTQMGVFVCPGGKKSGWPGYYVHIDPKGCFICAGLHMPEKRVLESFREEVVDNAQGLLDAAAAAEGFLLDTDGSLSRNPKGYPDMGPQANALLRLKDEALLLRRLPLREVTSPNFLDRCLELAHETYAFMQILYRSTQYAFEEM